VKNAQITAWAVAVISFVAVVAGPLGIIDGVISAGVNAAIVMLVGTAIVKVWRRKHPELAGSGASDAPEGAWHTDPEDPSRLRYWTGRQWTNAYAFWDGGTWFTRLWRDGAWTHGQNPTTLPPPTTSVAPPSIPDGGSSESEAVDPRAAELVNSLRQLKQLHAEGILTNEEYESKRKKLADQL
jgi:hypothetical protein